MTTQENSSWEPEYDDDEYAENETAALEAQALQNLGESEDEDEDSDGSRTGSDGDSSSSDDESTESPEQPGNAILACLFLFALDLKNMSTLLHHVYSYFGFLNYKKTQELQTIQ